MIIHVFMQIQILHWSHVPYSCRLNLVLNLAKRLFLEEKVNCTLDCLSIHLDTEAFLILDAFMLYVVHLSHV
jgi:hypothetical protein